MKKLNCLVALALCLAFVGAAVAQDLHPSRKPSPTDIVSTFVGDAYVSITYSRPYKRGRDNIFGTKESEALVPFGEVWRTGANAATQLTATGAVSFGGKTLPAGTYSVFSIPGPDKWTIHFNSRLGLNGTSARNPETREMEYAYSPDNDVLVIEVTPSTLDDEVDQFTMSFDTEGDGTDMVWQWIKTEVRVPLAAG
jgi:Protein of unknown function (DUF2911)